MLIRLLFYGVETTRHYPYIIGTPTESGRSRRSASWNYMLVTSGEGAGDRGDGIVTSLAGFRVRKVNRQRLWKGKGLESRTNARMARRLVLRYSTPIAELGQVTCIIRIDIEAEVVLDLDNTSQCQDRYQASLKQVHYFEMTHLKRVSNIHDTLNFPAMHTTDSLPTY